MEKWNKTIQEQKARVIGKRFCARLDMTIDTFAANLVLPDKNGQSSYKIFESLEERSSEYVQVDSVESAHFRSGEKEQADEILSVKFNLGHATTIYRKVIRTVLDR